VAVTSLASIPESFNDMRICFYPHANLVHCWLFATKFMNDEVYKNVKNKVTMDVVHNVLYEEWM
jgi:hypothetical protein